MASDKNSDFEDPERQYEGLVAHRYNRDYHEPPIMHMNSQDFVSFVKQRYNIGEFVGVDLSPNMIEEAKGLYPDGDFRIGSMFSIPSSAGEFDIAIVSSAFHHVPDSELPVSLKEISRVMDEHGVIIGREPLMTGRVGDRGGWLAGFLMALRHLAYRLTHTCEYPEPDPGTAHNAYVASEFLTIIGSVFTVTDIQFRNPVSHFLSRVRN